MYQATLVYSLGFGTGWQAPEQPECAASLTPTCRYLWLYVLVLKSFLVYVSDIFTAVTMLTTKSWSNQIFNDCPDLEGCVAIPFNVGKWLFVGCIIFSFLLVRPVRSHDTLHSTDMTIACVRVP